VLPVRLLVVRVLVVLPVLLQARLVLLTRCFHPRCLLTAQWHGSSVRLDQFGSAGVNAFSLDGNAPRRCQPVRKAMNVREECH
jgi:hypothetical protein